MALRCHEELQKKACHLRCYPSQLGAMARMRLRFSEHKKSFGNGFIAVGTVPRHFFQYYGDCHVFTITSISTITSYPYFCFFFLRYHLITSGGSIGSPQHGVHSLDTRHSLGPRDVVPRYLGLVSPVCCAGAVRVERRFGPLGQDCIYFSLLHPDTPTSRHPDTRTP